MSHSTIIIHSNSVPTTKAQDPEMTIDLSWAPPDHLTPVQVGGKVMRLMKLVEKMLAEPNNVVGEEA